MIVWCVHVRLVYVWPPWLGRQIVAAAEVSRLTLPRRVLRRAGMPLAPSGPWKSHGGRDCVTARGRGARGPGEGAAGAPDVKAETPARAGEGSLVILSIECRCRQRARRLAALRCPVPCASGKGRVHECLLNPDLARRGGAAGRRGRRAWPGGRDTRGVGMET